ncbi:hypothetical protein BDQ17DRAFT_954648 [Cyathus striatus]|nr:hypothetical protein BDQ17DRAFT_954648 [Cyathus striatus]
MTGTPLIRTGIAMSSFSVDLNRGFFQHLHGSGYYLRASLLLSLSLAVLVNRLRSASWIKLTSIIHCLYYCCCFPMPLHIGFCIAIGCLCINMYSGWGMISFEELNIFESGSRDKSMSLCLLQGLCNNASGLIYSAT